MNKVSLPLFPFASNQAVTGPEKPGSVEINTLHVMYNFPHTLFTYFHLFFIMFVTARRETKPQKWNKIAQTTTKGAPEV